jgi:hypothetical protein
MPRAREKKYHKNCRKQCRKGGIKIMTSAKKIRVSLINQLKNKGADAEHFLGLIDDYIWYFNQEKAAQKDIKIRGRTYMAVSASGNEYEKENPSVKESIMYNKQKLEILKQLGLTTNNVGAGDDDEDDL